MLPDLPDFLARYPGLRVHIGEGDRWVDLVREGVDCVLRVGDLTDSSMVGRRIAMLEEVTCASPAYLERHGVPQTPDDLDGIKKGLRHLRYKKHEVMILQIMDPQEIDFPFQDVTLFKGLEEMGQLLTEPRSLRSKNARNSLISG